jgi:Zn-dependent protease
VPPLDGSRIIRYFLPYNVEKLYDRIGIFGSLLLFFVAMQLILPVFYPPLLRAFDTLLVHL